MDSTFLTDGWAVVGYIAPISNTASATADLSQPIDMSLYDQIEAYVMAGVIQATGTVDATFTASATYNGTYAAVTGAAITQIATSGKLAAMGLKRSALPVDAKFVKLSVVSATADSLGASIVLGKRNHSGITDATDGTTGAATGGSLAVLASTTNVF